ncbi:aminotransferase class III-fold pyridoxal phosphate-dependent enzyme [Bradyrhizobium ottawaense]
MTRVVRGDGAYLYTADGRQIIDAISSWWVVTHGHCHPQFGRIQEQAGRLNQIIFAGYTHDPAGCCGATLEGCTARPRSCLLLR